MINQDVELLDDRQHCCTIHCGTGEKFYLSAESRSDLLQLEKAWYKTNHTSITSMKVSIATSNVQVEVYNHSSIISMKVSIATYNHSSITSMKVSTIKTSTLEMYNYTSVISMKKSK